MTQDSNGGIVRPELLLNACQQALLLLDRERFEDDPECKVVRAVLRTALIAQEYGPQEVSGA